MTYLHIALLARKAALLKLVSAAGRLLHPFWTPYTVQDAEALSTIAGKYGFCDLMTYTYHRTRIFSASEYISLLGTYSNVIAMEEPIRCRFLAEIEDAINGYGGTLTIYDTIDLQLARKPY